MRLLSRFVLACGFSFAISGFDSEIELYGQSAPADSTAYERWYEALREVQPDPDRGAAVSNLTIRRDVGALELIDGELFLFEPIANRTVGAVFIGQGRFSFFAPVEVEKRQLERFFSTDSIVEEIKAAVLFFTDSTADQLAGMVDWEARTPPSNARREIEEALKYLSDDDGWMHRDLMLPVLNETPGFFYAHVADSRGDPRVFSIDPYDFEEVSLCKRAEGREHRRETVAKFHLASDYESGTSRPQEALDLVGVSHYDIETTIEANLDLTGMTTATLRHIDGDHSWVPFRLYSGLDVDSIKWVDGGNADFFRAEETTDMWVDVSSAPGDSTGLTFFYNGELLERFRDMWIYVKSAGNWYPLFSYGRFATYDMTFHVPEKFSVLTVGNLVSDNTNGRVTTTVWRTPPVRQVTFNIGEFEDHVVEDSRIPKLHVQISVKAHRSLAGMVPENYVLLRQRDMAGEVTADIGNSFAFFSEVYGPTPIDEFRATEIAYTHGQAFPGLLLLSWTTYQWTSESGLDEMFRAHEVAHQWWGVGVQPATYRDKWLSEGFAEFSGLWYMGRVTGSTDLFLDWLEESRKEILDRRDEAAPICLGTRAGTSEYPGDYELVVYKKGAWVLHMLRNLFIDLDTGNDDAFAAMMKSFYMNRYGETASTEQFKAVVERHAGIPMDWFFEQWVYGSAIPTYRFSYNLEELENGEYETTVRVRQEDVPDDFRMLVPILLDFGSEGTAWVRIDVTGPETEMVLPILPMRPDRIVFNPFESVLADTKTERWRD